jgi:hypothetical protein
LCTNGMSNSMHSSPWANAALVTTFGPQEYGPGPFAGVDFQESLERRFFEAGGGDYTAPAQSADDFLAGRLTAKPRHSSYTFGTCPGRIDTLLPPVARDAISRSLSKYERQIPGFGSAAGLLVGLESRSSGPIRLPRDRDTSVADGFTVPQVLTQTQILQSDDNIVGESECFNMETDQGFQSTPYVETYQCLYPPCTGAPISSIAAPWTRGPGCGSEIRDDSPGMSCDTNGTYAYTINDSSSSCGTFAQTDFEFTSELLYTPIIVPTHTGNAPNGQPWFHNWIYAEWFFWVDNWVDSIPAISTTQLWTDDYTGVATPGVNDINDFPYWMGNFYGLSPQPWDSATPWDPANPPANLDGIFLTGVAGETRAGMQWRWAIWERDIDATLARSPVASPANGGIAYDDLNLVYDQYHAEAQTTACAVTEALGTVSFDQFNYAECSGGVLGVSVLDGNGSDPVTVTVTSNGTSTPT